MGRILNALRYGNAKTKGYIILITLLFLTGALGISNAIRGFSPLWAMVGVFAILLAFIFMNSLEFKNANTSNSKTKKNTSKDQMNTQNEQDLKEEKEVVSNSSGIRKDEREYSDTNLEDENYFEKYDEASIKRLFYRYKVKKNPIPIMIDSWESKGIIQCPAYIWVDKTYFHILTIGREANKYELPRKSLQKMTYNKGCVVDIKKDYDQFKKPSLLSLAFSELLPTVYVEGEGIRAKDKKNLYVLTADLTVTNTSVKVLLDLLQVNFTLLEEEVYSKKYSPYFTSAYKLNILLKDGVLTVSDYKRKIKEVLLDLAEAQISLEVFKIYINQLIQGRLVTKEYAEYYLDYRMKRKERSSSIERK